MEVKRKGRTQPNLERLNVIDKENDVSVKSKFEPVARRVLIPFFQLGIQEEN